MPTISVFDQQVSTATTKVIEANLNLFNTATNGALLMGTGASLGDWVERTFWAAQQLVRRRNAYGSGKLSPTELAQALERAIKIDGGTLPLKVTPALMDRLGKTPQEAAAVMGEQVALQMIEDYLACGLGAFIAATPKGLNYDFTQQSGGALPKIRNLIKASGQLGDAQNRLACWVMSGNTYNDLLAEDAFVNGQNLFKFETINVIQDGLGRRFVVTDAAAALDASVPGGAQGTEKARQRVLGLMPGAVTVTTRPLQMYSQTILGEENVYDLMQGEYNFDLALKGHTYIGAKGSLGNGDKATSPTPKAEQNASANTSDDASASPTLETITASTSWQITDKRGITATTGRLKGDDLEVAKGLGGLIVTFGEN
ncbi:TPA: major capsid protein [Enterobacter hormaechei]